MQLPVGYAWIVDACNPTPEECGEYAAQQWYNMNYIGQETRTRREFLLAECDLWHQYVKAVSEGRASDIIDALPPRVSGVGMIRLGPPSHYVVGADFAYAAMAHLQEMAKR